MARVTRTRSVSSLPSTDKPSAGSNECTELFHKVCQKLHLVTNQRIINGYSPHSLRLYLVNICLDALQRKDIDALISTLPKLSVLTKIQVFGGGFETAVNDPELSEAGNVPGGSVPKEEDKPKLKKLEAPNPWNKTESNVQQDVGNVGFSRSAGVVIKVIKAVSLNLQNNNVISELRLVGLKVAKSGWSILGKGLSSAQMIDYLALNYCKMDDPALEILIPALQTLPRLRKLDLSNNQLANRSGFLLGRLISLHSLRKDEISWLNNLRNESTDSELLQGLEEVCIANNKLPDKSIFDLCRVLNFDSWLKLLDLRRNPLGPEGGIELVSMLRSNASLLVVDMRETTVLDPNLYREIVKKLSKNLRNARKRIGSQRYRDYQQKIEEIATDFFPRSRKRHIESVSFQTAEMSHDVQIEEMLGSYLSESPKDLMKRSSNSSCKQCRSMEKQLMRSESQCVTLKLANKSLRSSINSKPASTATVSKEKNQYRRIETLMAELTHLIDNLKDS